MVSTCKSIVIILEATWRAALEEIVENRNKFYFKFVNESKVFFVFSFADYIESREWETVA